MATTLVKCANCGDIVPEHEAWPVPGNYFSGNVWGCGVECAEKILRRLNEEAEEGEDKG